MKFNIGEISSDCDFYITGASYIGAPRDNTVMYVSSKIGALAGKLEGHKECLVFAQSGMEVPEKILQENKFIFTDNPQLAYARFVSRLAEESACRQNQRRYRLTQEGYYVGENVRIGNQAYIEPGCLIGHDVVIGHNARILAGAVVRNAVIADDFLCCERAVVGNSGFTMARDENANLYRIPALGRVLIGNKVEVGVCNDVARGVCGDTVLEDCVKLDSLVHIGHEAYLHKNTEITAGTVIGGFADIGENVFVGVGAAVRNRICLGEGCIIGMGAVVTADVEPYTTVVGNPARLFTKKKSGGGVM